MFESLKVALIKKVAILIMSAKLATLGLPKINVTWKKGYDVIIFAHDVSNKILSSYSNYMVDVVIWPKFGNSSIFMTEVIITSILQGLGTGTRYGLGFLGSNPYVCWSYSGKTSREPFCRGAELTQSFHKGEIYLIG